MSRIQNIADAKHNARSSLKALFTQAGRAPEATGAEALAASAMAALEALEDGDSSRAAELESELDQLADGALEPLRTMARDAATNLGGWARLDLADLAENLRDVSAYD